MFRGKHKHRMDVLVMLPHGDLPASGHLCLRSLRDEEGCGHSWEPLIDVSPVNLSDGIHVDLKHLKMPVIPKDCSSCCSSNLSLSVSFLPLNGVRGDKEEPLYSTVRTIPTRDTLGCFHGFSVAWDIDVGVYSPKAFILVTILLKPIVHFL